MPEAVELTSRRSGRPHPGLGLHLIAEELKGLIADEFNRVFEEQNFGAPVELRLRNMADRIRRWTRVLRDRGGSSSCFDLRRPGRGPRQDRPADPPAVKLFGT